MRSFFPFVVALAVAMFADVAQADIVVPEPKRDACSGKSDNDACELEGKPGTCKKQTCSRKVGGVLNPHYIDEDCLLCDLAKQGSKSDEPTPTPTPVKADPAKPEPSKEDPAKAEPEPTPTPAKAEPPAPAPPKPDESQPEQVKTDASTPATAEPKTSSICSVSPDATPLASAALGLLLLALARPRRR